MIEHVDCLTYRLDAWQTALFYKKLELNRSSGLASGTVLGAYGWLENLKPAENVTLMQESDLPLELQPGTGMPIIRADDQGGYIHAPSLTQAKAAALLRNAYLHHHDPAEPTMMAVNLSSSRVRKALEIFEGIQKGHTIGELLGYRLERHLHDYATPLDQYIPVLRKAFPLGGKTLPNPGRQPEQPSSAQVDKPAAWVARLDGLALVNAVKGGNGYPFGLHVPLPGSVLSPETVRLPETGDAADAMQQGIDDLLDCIDAMKDLMVAESVHQIVQGNLDRAGALLKSIHELKPPAQFEAIRTPRTPAEILTHRAALLFEAGDFNNPPNPWPSVPLSHRARTEPGLNQWLGEIIGAPHTLQCTVTDADSNMSSIVTIEDLNLQPIDLVYLAPLQLDNEDSELAQRIAYHYRVTQKISAEIAIQIDYAKAAKDNLSLAELLPLLALLKEVVTNAKALDGADFDLQQYPGKANFRNLNVKNSGAGASDIGSLLHRKENLTTALELLLKKLKQIADTQTATLCADLRQCLIECCDFDLRDAFPKSALGEDDILRDALLLQAGETMRQMEKMLDSARPINWREEDLVQSFSLFFGPAFKVLPVFHFTKNEDDEVERVAVVQEAYDAESAIFYFITDKTNLPLAKHLQNWLDQVAYLRPKLAAFESVRLLYNAFHAKQLELHIMQLPYAADDSWLGLEFPAGQPAGQGKLTLLVHHFPQNSSPKWSAPAFSGLLLDEWVEEIPGAEELTGISFQYNQPNSQPPQALLLAISPSEGKYWDWDKLSDILDDTLRRAKQRAVGTNDLAKADWIGVLPAILAEFSATKANISLFFKN